MNIDDFLTDKILNPILESFKYIFEPIKISYSNEILVQQIHSIAVLLFILGLIIFTFINTLIISIVLILFALSP